MAIGGTPISVVIDLMVMGRCQYGGCDDEEGRFLKVLFPVTYYLWEKTGEVRCPNNSYYINKFVDTAQCYLDLKTVEGQKTGHLLMKYLYEKSREEINCINDKDEKRIRRVYEGSTI